LMQEYAHLVEYGVYAAVGIAVLIGVLWSYMQAKASGMRM